MAPIVIRWDDPEKWENTREQVYLLLEKHTGRREYPETRSLPPFIVGIDMPQEGIDELNALDGVKAQIQD
ncbi:hypothetical protein FAUST_7079 [Fusarium austroamericanum]|uniref:Uncharacterized protein n=1 Tax=Fusarium austroamericanum TaxID=282268 RepID=A0AAN6BYV4_FUSAU|nr:hypothetical protein FAUST_7079 [Fusarium austroamericanum]